jgi:hypothetical protein
VRKIAAGKPGESALDTLDRLLAHLREQLQAGAYIR